MNKFLKLNEIFLLLWSVYTFQNYWFQLSVPKKIPGDHFRINLQIISGPESECTVCSKDLMLAVFNLQFNDDSTHLAQKWS